MLWTAYQQKISVFILQTIPSVRHAAEGFVFLLALVALASPIGLMVFMGYRFKLQAAEKAEPFFEFLTRPVRKLSARRHDSYIDLLNETNMVVGPRPSADTYYDSKARIKFENAEVFSNSEM